MKKTVLIDPGHGGKKPGAVRAKIYEKDLNLFVALKLAKALSNVCEVVMTREDDSNILLKDRVKQERSLNPDLTVAIHMNASRNINARGHEVWYVSESGLKIAQAIEDAFTSALPELKARGTKEDVRGLTILRDTKSTAVLVECVFLSNEHDREWICNESNQEKLVEALAEAITEYLGVAKAVEPDQVPDIEPEPIPEPWPEEDKPKVKVKKKSWRKKKAKADE